MYQERQVMYDNGFFDLPEYFFSIVKRIPGAHSIQLYGIYCNIFRDEQLYRLLLTHLLYA